ncbi:Amino acid adenylation domain-containing protein [Sulfidibacter corallicola]|uniref:Amino acid adenylation domain-containing protein n=1 Tax=Sulfidibacter corallicola TaxID=2818388 RepID=A0A8A4TFC5_SULCO|nr:non-ribosomal peptide synthetase [Sulfidibacter corallicola]QTD48799.1 amino acid adenylation domain-containing protein [Sulfidibacter corallicola]
MSNVQDLLSRLRRAGINLWLEGEKLRFSAPKGAMTAALRADLAATKADIVAFLGRQAPDREAAPKGPRPVDRNQPLPLSFAQQRLWFLEQLEGATGAYHIPVAWRFGGVLSRPDLEDAARAVARRHEALRTRFERHKGRPVQVIDPEPRAALIFEDLGSHDASVRETHLSRLLDADMRRPFDLEAAPPWRMTLIRLADDDWVVALTIHHIIADGLSLELFFVELAHFYGASGSGSLQGDRIAALPELPIQYADFAHWQHHQVGGPRLAQSLHFWKRRLADLPPLLELPTDRPRPARRGHEGAVHEFRIDAELWTAIRAFCGQRATTPFSVLLAAFDLLLARLSGQTDLVVGVPVSDRAEARCADLIGMFINTLVLRAQLDLGESFSTLTERVAEVALEANEHRAVPFEQLVQIVAPERKLGVAPLFQVMFNLELEPGDRFDLAGLTKRPLFRPTVTAKFDLLLSLKQDDRGLHGFLEYSTELFDGDSVANMQAMLVRVLTHAIADPDSRLGDIPLLARPERLELIRSWNRTDRDFPHEGWVHELFEAQAHSTPDAPALLFEDAVMTYAELDRAANRLAHVLMARGVRPEDRVGICLERCPDMVISILAILKAGAAWLPLDPEYPTARLARLVADGQPRVVLGHARHVDLLPGSVASILLDRPLPEAPDQPPRVAVDGANLAYVLFTSGSTGVPKGAGIPHRALLNRLQWMQAEYGLTADDVVLQKTPFSFDVSIWEFLWPLIQGARLVLAAPGDHRDNLRLIALIQRHGVTTMHFVPSMLRAFLETPGVSDCDSLVRVIASGEALPDQTCRRFRQRLKATLHNLYGPTEAAIDVSAWPCEQSRPYGVVPIGRPIANIRLYILDGRGRPVPRGVHGELHIAGIGLARGYVGRPGLTAERFVPDPFAPQPGARMYRTGDRARYLRDGNIEFLGRVDHQIKLRGFRIEPGEIEARLLELADVREAVVLAREDRPGDPRLVAWLVGPEESLDPDALRRKLSRHLPDYMVPADFVLLAALPLTANGKLDRKALPAPEGPTAPAQTYVAPTTAEEEALAEIWRQLLRVPRVGIHDDFFHLGGHSLLATQAVSLIQERLGRTVAVRDLFEAPTVAAMAGRLRPATSTAEPERIEPRPRPERIPLSFAQQRLWFLEKLEGHSATYNIPAALRMRGDLHREALIRAIETILIRHESLRTHFAEDAEGPVQVIAEPGGLDLENVDLRHLPVETREAEAAHLVQREAMRPFDLSRDALFRVMLIQLDSEDHVLLATMHHIISDGWSLGVLVHEFTTLYEAFAADRPSPLPELAVQYADFALWQRDVLQDEVVRRHLAYWSEQLKDLAPLELPTDHPRPPVQTHRGANEGFRISADLAERLRAISRDQGVSLFMTLLAAFYILLARYSGQHDIAIGSPIANRTRRELEGLIGFFVNTLVLRADLAGNPSFFQLLAQVKEVCLGAYTHQDLPFEQLADVLQPERHLSHSLWFQVMFNVQHAQGGGSELAGLDVSTWGFENTSAKFDLTFALLESDAGLHGSMEYNTDLFERETVQRMLRHYHHLLEAITADPRRPIGFLPIAEPANALPRPVSPIESTPAESPSTWPDLFESQVARSPEAIAVDFDTQTLSYAALNRRANRLAHVLRQRGVGPESRVALCFERGPHLVVAMLAVLKAGACYLPLDPNYPPERLEWMLSDARPTLVLTKSPYTARFRGAGYPALCLESDAGMLEAAADHDPDRRTLPQHPAYLIYTSGSTGKPKGVVIEHGALINHNRNAIDVYGLTPNDRVLQFSSVSFDISVEEVLPTLLVGACLVPYPDDGDMTPSAFETWLRKRTITVANLPTAYWSFWMRHPGALPANLRMVVIGGEECTEGALSRWVGKAEDRVALCNTYGPTETTVIASIWPFEKERRIRSRVPIGRAIDQVDLHILDPYLQPLPVGIPGDLYISGACLGRGYLNRPDLTAERWLPLPLGAEPGARMYRTGDRARRLADGQIEFLGRGDDQVKIRGFRVEPGEVEAALTGLEGVEQAAVLVMRPDDGIPYLVGYYADRGDASPSVLRHQLRQALPEYLVPRTLVPLAAMPLTPNGKIDREALRAIDPGELPAATPIEEPQAPNERMVASVWCRVLGLARVGRGQNFFELGGSSLPAVQIVTQLQQRFGIELSIRVLFESPVLEAFAFEVLKARALACDEDELPALVEEVPEHRVEEFLESLEQFA